MKHLTKEQKTLREQCRVRTQQHLKAVRERPQWDESMDKFREEYALATAMEAAKTRSGLTQTEIAARMGIPQSNVSRIESRPAVSFRTFVSYLKACGFTFSVNLMPDAVTA